MERIENNYTEIVLQYKRIEWICENLEMCGSSPVCLLLQGSARGKPKAAQSSAWEFELSLMLVPPLHIPGVAMTTEPGPGSS